MYLPASLMYLKNKYEYVIMKIIKKAGKKLEIIMKIDGSSICYL